MKLNTKITIESVYKEDIDSNSVSFSADLKMTASEFLTTLTLAKSTFIDVLQNASNGKIKDVNKWLKKVTLEELYATQKNK